MKCKKCDSEKVTAISEYIETKEKSGTVFFVVLCVIFIAALLLSISLFVRNGESQMPGAQKVADTVLALEILKYTLPTLFATIVLMIISPYKHVTNTKFVCLECGNTWYLEENVKYPPAEEESENKTNEQDNN